MKFIHLQKYVPILQQGTKKILQLWMKNQDVHAIFKNYNIDLAFFIQKFAIVIVSYYTQVIKGDARLEDCPVDGKLMHFFASKGVASEDFFLVCINFKNAFIQFAYEKQFFSYEVLLEIDDIFKYNFFGVLQHYTAHQKKIENELILSQKLEDNYILKSSFDIKGKILDASQAFCEISGFTKEELIGKEYTLLQYEADNSFEDILQMVKIGKPWHGEIKNKKKDGGFFWVDATIIPIVYNGKIIKFNSIAKDITDKKELIEQSKSAAMGEMISMIAHQWRQPLQTISILAQKLSITMMTDGELKPEMIDKVVDDIGVQLGYMSKTIDDFRDFFKPNKKQEKITLYAITQKAYQFLEMMFKTDSIEFKTNVIEDALVNIHINELVQVLINIFKNAKDAMSQIPPEKRILTVTIFHDNGMGILEVEDSGCGIPNHLLGRIFEPYFSTKTSKNGTGLGLYMCKTIIEQHCNGKLSARNGGSGAIFRIELPLYNP